MKPDIFQHAVFNAPLDGWRAKKREWTLPPSFFTVHLLTTFWVVFTAVFEVTVAALPVTFCCASLILLLATLSWGLVGGPGPTSLGGGSDGGGGGGGGLAITFFVL